MAELKINALNQLRLLKQSTFKDPICFLDEDIQNAQRAKAKNVTIKTDYFAGTITIFNDGEVLDDPQKLFSIAESGWEDESVKAENPFGIGFFSNIVVSNLIVIKTGDKIIKFDVDRMLNEGDTQVEVHEIEDEIDYLDGFEMTLNNVDVLEISNRLEERAQLLSNFIHELTITFNGKTLEHKELNEFDEGVTFGRSIENDMGIGWVAPVSAFCWNYGVDIYYKGRFITKLSSVPYSTGRFHINDNTLNLVAPDRKDIIEDDKLNAFKAMLMSEMKKLCNDIASDSRNDISDYTCAINHYIDVDAVKNNIMFLTFKTNDENAMNYLDGYAAACETNKDIKSLEDYEAYLKDEKSRYEYEESIEINMTDYDYEPEYNEDYDKVRMPVDGKNYVEQHSKVDPLGIINESQMNTDKIKGETLINSSEPVFYLGYSEITNCHHKLAIARHYNLRIVIARNSVENNILENMKETDDGAPVVHINTLQEDVDVFGNVTNLSLTAKEKRAQRIFGMISAMFGYEENIFVIGDVAVTKRVRIESIGVEKTVEDTNIKILYDKHADTIFIDRKIINGHKLTPNLSSKLNLSDVQFILGNLDNISKAMAGFNMCGYLGGANENDIANTKSTILDLLSRYNANCDVPCIDAEKRAKMPRKEKKRKAKLANQKLSN